MTETGVDGFQVFVRIRPVSSPDRTSKTSPMLRSSENEVKCTQIWLQDQRFSQRKEMRFVFHGVFDETASTAALYRQVVKPMLGSVTAGFSATCFAYGMTGSGKTHTMFGSMYFQHAPELGLIPLVVADLFTFARSRPGACFLTVSYLEIYNEQVRDLLTSKASSRSQGLMLVEDPVRGVIASDLTEQQVTSLDEFTAIVLAGNSRRTMAATGANQFSSRSHAVLQVAMELKTEDRDGRRHTTLSRLCLIDLAGSERAAVTENRGTRLLEGANINRSLLALGNCINILSNPEKAGKFVPFRDSKLTRLLKDALGGRTRTIMVACVSPSFGAFEETLHTLKYAERARHIKVSAAKNVKEDQLHVSEYKAIIAALKAEVESLKDRMTSSVSPSFVPQPQIDGESLGQELTRNFEEGWELRQSIQEVETLNQENKRHIKDLVTELEYVETINDSHEERRIKAEIRRIHENVKENEDELRKLQDALQVNLKNKGKLQRELAALRDDKQRDLLQMEVTVRTLKMEKMDLYIQNQEMRQEVADSRRASAEKEKLISTLRQEMEEMKKQLTVASRGVSEGDSEDPESSHAHISRQSSMSFLSLPPDMADGRYKGPVISDLNRVRAMRKAEISKSAKRSESAEGFLAAYPGSGSRGDETTLLQGVKEQTVDEEVESAAVPQPKVKVSSVSIISKRFDSKRPSSKNPKTSPRSLLRVRSVSNARERPASAMTSKARSPVPKKEPPKAGKTSMSKLLASLHRKILSGEEAESLVMKTLKRKETPMVAISLRGSKPMSNR